METEAFVISPKMLQTALKSPHGSERSTKQVRDIQSWCGQAGAVRSPEPALLDNTNISKTLLLYHLLHGLRLEALQSCHSINALNESGILIIL